MTRTVLETVSRVRGYVRRRITPSPKPLSVLATDFEDKKRGFVLSVASAYGAGVEGNVVEFETMTGRTAMVLAHSMLSCEREWAVAPKRLFLLDSFEGLPVSDGTADEDSPHVKTGVWAPGTCRVLSEQRLRELCRRVLPPDRFEILAG